MSIAQYQEINQADLQAVIDAINTEISRRGLASPVVAPQIGDNIDDSTLDTLASKIVEIRSSHCYCQAYDSMTHSGCPSYINPSLQSSQVDEGVRIVASETSLPDVLDIQTDLNKLNIAAACSPQCTCNNDCGCHGVSNLYVQCPSQCNCHDVCSCQSDCNCVDACHCDSKVPPCNCDDVCADCSSNCGCASKCGCNAHVD